MLTFFAWAGEELGRAAGLASRHALSERGARRFARIAHRV